MDTTISFKTPSKAPRSAAPKAKSVIAEIIDQVVLSEVVGDLNKRNEKLATELEESKQELKQKQSINETTSEEVTKVRSDLEETIARLEESLLEAQTQLTVKEQQLEDVTVQKDDADKRLQTVNEEAAAKCSRIENLKEELKLLTQDNLTLEEQVERDKMAIEFEKKELEEKCTFLHFTQEQLHTEVQTLQGHISSLNTEMATLKQQLEITSKELEMERAKLAELTDMYVKENLDTENEFKRLTKESNLLHTQVTELETANTKLESNNCQLEKKLIESKNKLDDTVKEKDELLSRNEMLKTDLEVLTNDKEALSEELKRVEEEKNGVAFDLACITKDKSKIEDTIAGLQTEKEAVLNEIQVVLKEKQDLEDHLKSTKEELSKCQKQLSSLFESSEELQNIATQQTYSLEQKEKEVQDLQGEIQELDMKNSSLEGSLSSAQSEIANLESENKTLLVSFESVEDSLRSYIHRCEDLNMEIQELTSCKDDLNQTCLILEKRMLEAENTVKDDKHKIQELLAQIFRKDEDINKNSAQITELEAKVMDLQELVGLLEQRNQTAQEIHEEKSMQMEREIKVFITEKVDLEKRQKELLIDLENVSVERSQLVEMNQDLSGQVSDNLHTIKALQEREQELNGRLHVVCSQLEAAKTGMTSELESHWAAEDEILQLQAEMDQTNVQLNEATNKLTSLKSQIGGLSDQNAELENRYDNLDANHKISLEDLATIRQDLETKCAEIKKLKEQTEKMKNLESQLQSTEIENSSSKVELRKKSEEISSLNLSLEAQQRIIGEYEKKIEELEGDLKGTENFLRRFNEMESLLKEYMNDVKELEEKNSSNQKLIKVKDGLISNLRAELDPLQEETQTYKEKYEALLHLIEPFKEQLDSFEMEKAVLLARNKEAEGEVKKLATQYGQLLGHQNHKQKIQHLVKLKQENVDMREEMSGMRLELDKYRRLALKSESIFKQQNKENSILQCSVANMSTMGAGRTPAAIRSKSKTSNEEWNPKVMIFASTPYRRQTIASPLANRNHERSPRT